MDERLLDSCDEMPAVSGEWCAYFLAPSPISRRCRDASAEPWKHALSATVSHQPITVGDCDRILCPFGEQPCKPSKPSIIRDRDFQSQQRAPCRLKPTRHATGEDPRRCRSSGPIALSVSYSGEASRIFFPHLTSIGEAGTLACFFTELHHPPAVPTACSIRDPDGRG